jgi:tetratricopeptide (TPR) repeat protein
MKVPAVPSLRLLAITLWLAVGAATGLSRAGEASLDEGFRKANTAYTSGDFAEAVGALRQLAADGRYSAGALHNLGNAEWKVSRPGYAILAWERARSLDPFNRNTVANLHFARHNARVEAPVPGWFERYSSWLPAGWWLALATLGLWGGVALLVLPRVLGWRRADWHQGIAATLLAVFLLSVPSLLGLRKRAQTGVVLEDETPLRLTPTRDGETLAKLPAGEMARMERERGNYVYVRAEGDRAGWLKKSEFQTVWTR